jgi:hypothetical protein
MLLMTKIPESAEVIKKMTMTSRAISEVTRARGNWSRNRNKSFSVSAAAWVRMPPVWPSTQMAPLPNTVIQKILNRVGTRRTQTTNSRIVRPLEILAMKRPTKGAQEIHQAQ